MESSRREVEIKLPFDSALQARERLEGLGAARIHDRRFEDNVLFDRETDPLEPARRVLRLRRTGGRALLTFKAPVKGRHTHKVRVEEESGVADPDSIERILGWLGFTPRYRYQKYRTPFELEGVHVCLDETPLGCFVELEGDPASIDREAARLGFAPEDYILDSYFELHQKRCSERGVEMGDLVFEPRAGG